MGKQIKIDNRKAYHEFEILETLEVGLSLTGTEVKSVRMGKVSLKEGFVRITDGEMFLHDVHIADYPNKGYAIHQPLRKRKLLAHKKEIKRLHTKVTQKGITLVPLKVYFKKNWVKLLVGLGRGKKTHDKRDDLKKKDQQREIQRSLKQRDL